MARRKKPQAPRPQLARFLLVGMNVANGLVGQGAVRVTLRRESEFQIETQEPAAEGGSCRAIVRMKLAVFGRREKDDEDTVKVEGVYEARFVFPPELSVEEIDDFAKDEPFQYSLIAQAVPLGHAHLKDQLELMGLSATRMPLGL